MPSMKNHHHPTGRRYWQSVEELADGPTIKAILAHAGENGADSALSADNAEPSDDESAGAMNRRGFLKLMGASIALAGLTACRWPQEKIAPFATRPDDRIPGVPQYFATAFDLQGVACGLVVTSFDGRPIKIEGNPLHPINGDPIRIARRKAQTGKNLHPFNYGSASVVQQSLTLQIYDPDRSKRVMKNLRSPESEERADFAAFLRFWNGYFDDQKQRVAGQGDNLRHADGQGLAVVAEPSSSTTVANLRKKFLAAYPKAQWVEYDPLSRDAERDGAILAFGRPVRAQFDLSRANVVVTFDADLFDAHPAALKHARDFAHGRRRIDPAARHADPTEATVGGQINRLYAVESTFSNLGAAADHRFAVPATQMGRVVTALAHELFVAHKLAMPANATGNAAEFVAGLGDGTDDLSSYGLSGAVLHAIAEDLLANRGASALAVGPRQPAAVHALVHLINAALGNVAQAADSAPIYFIDEPFADTVAARPTHAAGIKALADSMAEGTVNTVVILGGNPVYDAPADTKFSEALSKVAHVIHLGLYRDETAHRSTWHIPQAHPLESWGDGRAWDGTVCSIQPLIEPLYGGSSAIELLATLTGETDVRGHQLVRRELAASVPGLGAEGQIDESAWQRLLHDGVRAETKSVGVAVSLQLDAIREGVGKAGESRPAAPSIERMELAFISDGRVHDGRFANLSWNLELPEFMTTLTWDNVALMGPVTANALGVKTEDNVVLQIGGASQTIPVYVMPGMPAFSVAVWVGYGRWHAGAVGNRIGANVYPLRSADSLLLATGLVVNRDRGTTRLASVQHNHRIADRHGNREQRERAGELLREVTVEKYKKDPEAIQHMGPHHPPLKSLWPEHDYSRNATPHRWAMAIDLNACIGCNACVIACQAENNIPTVGKAEVLNGREMHWLRNDRYFVGEADNPAVANGPIPCMQCENAPCEEVCPVAATVHDIEGLNVMIYNRCIGTRYCSNNCPWKVRRFNWFYNHGNLKEIEHLRMNPDVTVRTRGVMEKCTYCTQRIMKARLLAKRQQREIADGEILPACQQTCPTHAIVFGNLNDPNSVVSRLQSGHPRAYAQLAEMNAKPRTWYLGRIRNPNPNLKSDQAADGQHDDHTTRH